MPPKTEGKSREEEKERASTLESGEKDVDAIDTIRPPPRHATSRPLAPASPLPQSTPPSGAIRARMRPDVDALLERASSLIDQGSFERAARAALACMQSEPLDARGYLLCAVAQESLGRHALAELLLQRALSIDPESIEASLRLEILLRRSRRP